MSARKPFLALLGVAAFVLTTAVPADAGRLTRHDPAHDVVGIVETITLDEEMEDFRVTGRDRSEVVTKLMRGEVITEGTSAEPAPAPKPKVRNGDITRVFVKHGRHRLTLRMRMVAFRSPASTENSFGLIGAGFNVVDGRNNSHVFVQSIEDGQRYWDVTTGKRGREESPLRCKGLRLRTDVRNSTLEVIVPNKCLGGPRQVRVAAMSFLVNFRFNERDESITFGQYLDDGFRHGFAHSGNTVYTRPIRRG